jgi:dipeptidyl aminopeptidase/acylaminoacyl peptidase
MLAATVSLAGKGGGKGKPGGNDPPADPAIVFWQGGDLMVMDADGSNVTRVFDGGFLTGFPAWSPDASQIAFAIDEDGIYLMNADGTGVSRIVTLSAGERVYGVAWSPVATADGAEKIAFCVRDTAATTDVFDLYLVNVDGSGLTRLTTGLKVMSPTWSPDAERIAVKVAYPQRILVHDIGRVSGQLAITSTTDITTNGPLDGNDIYVPDWARTQDLIAVISQEKGVNPNELWIIPLANPSGAYRVVEQAGQTLSWSPDDSEILYLAGHPTRSHEVFYVVSLASETSTMIYDGKKRNLGMANWRRTP